MEIRHDLSEGYGFALSLLMLSVEVLLDQLLEGDGFWKIESTTLNTIINKLEQQHITIEIFILICTFKNIKYY